MSVSRQSRAALTHARKALWNVGEKQPELDERGPVACGLLIASAILTAAEVIGNEIAVSRSNAPVAGWPAKRGTVSHPCEGCGQVVDGNTLCEGWYRCNQCGYPAP